MQAVHISSPAQQPLFGTLSVAVFRFSRGAEARIDDSYKIVISEERQQEEQKIEAIKTELARTSGHQQWNHEEIDRKRIQLLASLEARTTLHIRDAQ